MADSIWQRAYDAIDSITTPPWLRDFLGELQDILIAIAFQIGKGYLDSITDKILEVAADEGLSSEQKFDKVFSFIRLELKLEGIKDHSLRLLIESIVARLKSNGKIK